MPHFSQVSLNRLMTCDQRLQNILFEVIKYIDFVVLEGHRDEERQDSAFATGHSKLRWPNGKHNSMPSKAVDIWPYHLGIKTDWRDVASAARLMGYIQRVALEQGVKLRFGLDWDGDFRTVTNDPDESFMDAPHLEIVE